MKEAKSYIYSSDLQKPDQNFRKVTSVSKVDRSDGLSMEMDVVQTSCQVSSKLSQEKVYTDACPVSNEYEKIKCNLKLDENKNGQLKCVYVEALRSREQLFCVCLSFGLQKFPVLSKMLPHSLKHLLKSSKTTEYQEQFNKQFEQVFHIERCLKQIVKSIRRFTDPNPSFTMVSSLIGENKISDAELFSECLLKIKQNCINTSSEKFLTFVASAEVKIEAARTLRNQQIHSFSIDPLNKILAEKIEEVKKEKMKLDRARAEYDLALEKLKAASEKNLDQLYNVMEEKKNAFEAQAHIMAQWMDSMPDVEQMIAKTLAAFIFFFMVVMPEINAEPSELDEAKDYIYQSDLQSGRGNFRRVLEVRRTSTQKSLEEVYSDECRTTKDEYDKIECHLKLDQSKSGQIECTYYAV
ncbi:BAR domain protein [Trichinella nativa]|uniref:BAR domain protein n=1 Tax=Trichinella nativa TaxID=6335 RepID=A0A1Y3EAP8_9BILA|nr:BAR domain protein [Trichinella nativa]